MINTTITRLVLDVLKPRDPGLLEFAETVASLQANTSVEVSVVEIDEQTETVVVKISGTELDYSSLKKGISDVGASIHSIDEVDVSSSIVKE